MSARWTGELNLTTTYISAIRITWVVYIHEHRDAFSIEDNSLVQGLNEYYNNEINKWTQKARMYILRGVRGGAVGWGTAVQAGRSRVRFPMVSLEFFIDIILPATLWPWGSTQPLTEMSTRNIFWGLRRPVRRADNLTTFMCRLSWNLGTSTSRNPQGLSRAVMGLLYLLPLYILRNEMHCCSHKVIKLLRGSPSPCSTKQ